MATIGSDSSFRDAWLTGAARAFFVCSYAEHCEEGHSTDNDLTPEEREARLDLPRPGGGEDWVDFAPETPPNAFALAGELWGRLEIVNGRRSVASLARDAYIADGGKDPDDWVTAIDAESFGHYLAMQAMGHGVSWFDDHERFPIEIPHMEVSSCSFSPDAYAEEE